jgi:hypothetical protein
VAQNNTSVVPPGNLKQSARDARRIAGFGDMLDGRQGKAESRPRNAIHRISAHWRDGLQKPPLSLTGNAPAVDSRAISSAWVRFAASSQADIAPGKNLKVLEALARP